MEAEITSWISETNWIIADGSLETCVTFESLDSPIDEATVSSCKSPLLLTPPSPNSGSCEIKITFTQKHEIRQVYVRSTARVYEIYYAPSLQSSNEYLCTVRCSVAAKEEELQHSTEIDEAESPHLKRSSKQLTEDKCKSDSSSTNEDDWVEVKVSDSSLLNRGNTSLPSKNCTIQGTNTQDLYEATAEISDAEPCISITLRLLSLQNKSCIYIDEVYIFADPVDSADSENLSGRLENSAGSSLMAMLVPTILQLTKTGANRTKDEHAIDTREKQNSQEDVPKVIDSTRLESKNQAEGTSSTTNQPEVKLRERYKAQIPTRVPDTEQAKDVPPSRIEGVLEQLVSRVSRIEELFVRFEENMLKPINNIEARLQVVEQQLEVLSKNSQYPAFPSCTRFSAPEFSCNESGSNSFYNDGSEHPNSEALESDKKVPVNATQLLPTLVVTAPDFSNGDDDEETGEELEVVMDIQSDKPKKVSIDEALSSALAGFVFSSSSGTQKYTQTLKVKAPEFSNEDSKEDEMSSQTGGIECMKGAVSSLESHERVMNGPLEGFGENEGEFEDTFGAVMKSFNVDHFKERQGVDACGEIGKGGDSQDTDIDGVAKTDKAFDIAKEVDIDDVAKTDNCFAVAKEVHIDNLAKNESCITKEVDIDDMAKIDKSCFGVAKEVDIDDMAETDECFDVAKEVGIDDMAETDECFDVTKEVESDDMAKSDKSFDIKEGDFLRNILEFSPAPSVVDFKSMILDVRFTSKENSSSPLEALLGDVAESHVEAQGGNDVAIDGEQGGLILVDDGEPSRTCDNLFVELDSSEIGRVDLNMGGEEVQDHSSRDQEMFEVSLI